MALTIVAGLFLLLSTVVPVLIARRTRESVAASATSGNADVLAGLLRLEGKVDTVRENVGSLLDWKAVHEAEHAQTSPVPVALVAAGRRSRPRA